MVDLWFRSSEALTLSEDTPGITSRSAPLCDHELDPTGPRFPGSSASSFAKSARLTSRALLQTVGAEVFDQLLDEPTGDGP